MVAENAATSRNWQLFSFFLFLSQAMLLENEKPADEKETSYVRRIMKRSALGLKWFCVFLGSTTE